MDTIKEEQPRSHRSLALKSRVLIFVSYVVTFWAISGLGVGDWRPAGQTSDAWFAAVVAVVAFRLLSSPFFKRPSESLAAALGAALLLAPLASPPAEEIRKVSDILRVIGLAIPLVVATAATSAMLLGTAIEAVAKAERHRKVSLGFTNALGGGEILFLAPALISILWFWAEAEKAILLVITWILVTTVEPFERLPNRCIEKRQVGPSEPQSI